jgi:hypothetical protein
MNDDLDGRRAGFMVARRSIGYATQTLGGACRKPQIGGEIGRYKRPIQSDEGKLLLCAHSQFVPNWTKI